MSRADIAKRTRCAVDLTNRKSQLTTSLLMSIHITLTPDEERRLTELARARGQDAATHAHDVVIAYINGADQKSIKSFAEILEPIWQGWRDTGITDGDVDHLFEQELRDARNERRQSKGTK
jgi:hypothetical protein